MIKKLLMTTMLIVALAVSAQADEQSDDVKVVLEENFDTFTDGSEDAPGTTDLGGFSGALYKDLKWGYSSKYVYSAGGKVKVASSGNIETGYLANAVKGQVAKIEARVRAVADYGEAVTFAIGYSFSKQIVVEDNQWHDVVIYTSAATTTSRLKISPLFEGFFLDNIKITTSTSMVVIPTPQLPSQADGVSFTAKWSHDNTTANYLLDVYSKAANGDKEYVLHDEEVTPTSSYASTVTKKVEGLDATKTYYYTVRGRNKNGNVSDYSEEIKVIKVIEKIDAPKAVAATNVTGNSFTANWEAVTDALRYAVTLSSTETLLSATSVKVVEDDFSKVTKGTLESIEFGSTQEELDAYTQTPGWYGVNHGFAAGYMVLSPFSGTATLTTPKIDLSSSNGAFTVNIKMAEGAYGYYYTGGKVTVNLYNTDPNVDNFSGTPLETKEVTLDSKTFTNYAVTFTKGEATSYVVVSYSGKSKIFIDEMNIEQEKQAGEKVTKVLEINETEDTHYNFTIDSPKDNTVYSYYVNAITETVESGEVVDLYSAASNTIDVTFVTTGIGETENANCVTLSAAGGVVTVSLPSAATIAVYDLAGRQLAQVSGRAGTNTVALACNQVVIVRVAGKSYKLAL